MRFNFTYTDFAKNDLLHAAKWYEKQQTGLGLRFLNTVEVTLKLVDKIPEGYAQKLTINKIKLRFAPIDTFPYSVVYGYAPNKIEIVIFAIWPQKKQPKEIQKALSITKLQFLNSKFK